MLSFMKDEESRDNGSQADTSSGGLSSNKETSQTDQAAGAQPEADAGPSEAQPDSSETSEGAVDVKVASKLNIMWVLSSIVLCVVKL